MARFNSLRTQARLDLAPAEQSSTWIFASKPGCRLTSINKASRWRSAGLLGAKLHETVLKEAVSRVGCDLVSIFSDILKNIFANNLTLKFLVWKSS